MYGDVAVQGTLPDVNDHFLEFKLVGGSLTTEETRAGPTRLEKKRMEK